MEAKDQYIVISSEMTLDVNNSIRYSINIEIVMNSYEVIQIARPRINTKCPRSGVDINIQNETCKYYDTCKDGIKCPRSGVDIKNQNEACLYFSYYKTGPGVSIRQLLYSICIIIISWILCSLEIDGQASSIAYFCFFLTIIAYYMPLLSIGKNSKKTALVIFTLNFFTLIIPFLILYNRFTIKQVEDVYWLFSNGNSIFPKGYFVTTLSYWLIIGLPNIIGITTHFVYLLQEKLLISRTNYSPSMPL
jgi:hypothetical protein